MEGNKKEIKPRSITSFAAAGHPFRLLHLSPWLEWENHVTAVLHFRGSPLHGFGAGRIAPLSANTRHDSTRQALLLSPEFHSTFTVFRVTWAPI